MDSSSKSCERRQSIVGQVMSNMQMYCLNVMRKRTADQQLGDFSGMMHSPLELSISYKASELQVTYSIGSEISASVVGVDESTCVRQCKLDLLGKLKTVCGYTGSNTKKFFGLVGRNGTSDPSAPEDIYSETELYELARENAGKKAKAFNNIVLVDGDMNIPGAVSDLVETSKSPLVFTITYFPTEREMAFEIGPYRSSATSRARSSSMRQCKTQLLQQLSSVVGHGEYRTDNKVTLQDGHVGTASSQSEAISDRSTLAYSSRNDAVKAYESNGSSQNKPLVQRQEPNGKTNESFVRILADRPPVTVNVPGTNGDRPKTPFNILKAYEKYVTSASAVMRDLTPDTFTQSADVFFDILVQTNHANRFYLWRVTDQIVLQAIDRPENSTIYAELCSHAIGKACVDPRETVRNAFPRLFKDELVKSCQNVLRMAGVFPYSGPYDESSRIVRRHDIRNERESKEFDLKARANTLGTCRFMGELFMQERFKMLTTVQRTVNTFLRTNNALSLDGLCVLLSRIGARFEKISGAAAAPCLPSHVYGKLGEYLAAGRAANNPLPGRTMAAMATLLNTRHCYWADGAADHASSTAGPVRHRTHEPSTSRRPRGHVQQQQQQQQYRDYRDRGSTPVRCRDDADRRRDVTADVPSAARVPGRANRRGRRDGRT